MDKSLEIRIKKTENGFIIESNKSVGGMFSYGYGKRRFVAESTVSMKSKVAEIIDGFKF